MKNDLTCAVVRDLLPAYAEHLTAPETDEAVERHLAGCPDCATRLDAMRAPEPEPEAETAKEVDYLKKVKRRSWKRVVLAVLLTVLVLAGALAAKVFLIGSPASADTMATGVWDDGGTLHVEVASAVSANTYWGWKTEAADGIVTITAREGLVSPLHHAASAKLSVPLKGVEEVYLCGRLIWQDGTNIDACTTALFSKKTPYVGNASAVGALLSDLSFWYGPLDTYTLSLQTSSQPYGLLMDFSQGTVNAAELRQQMRTVSTLLLALVENLEQVSWRCTVDGVVQTHTVSLEETNAMVKEMVKAYNAALNINMEPLESVKDYAASAAALQQLCHLLEE